MSTSNRAQRRLQKRQQEKQVVTSVQEDNSVKPDTTDKHSFTVEDTVQGFNGHIGAMVSMFTAVCSQLVYTQRELLRITDPAYADMVNPKPHIEINAVGDLDELKKVLEQVKVSTTSQAVSTQIPSSPVVSDTKKPLRFTPVKPETAQVLENIDVIKDKVQTLARAGIIDRLHVAEATSASPVQEPIQKKKSILGDIQRVHDSTPKLVGRSLNTPESLIRAYLHGSEVIRGRGNICPGLAYGDNQEVENAGAFDNVECIKKILPTCKESFDLFNNATAEDDVISAFFATITVYEEKESTTRVFVLAHNDTAWEFSLVTNNVNRETVITSTMLTNVDTHYQIVNDPDAEDITALENILKNISGV